jgi:putative transposase
MMMEIELRISVSWPRELKRFSVEVLAWCLMTNHTHLIVVPSDAGLLARAIGEAHRRYTRMKNFSDGVRGYLFQGRFGSCVLDERHLLAAARYVELNPVNAGSLKKRSSIPGPVPVIILGSAKLTDW